MPWVERIFTHTCGFVTYGLSGFSIKDICKAMFPLLMKSYRKHLFSWVLFQSNSTVDYITNPGTIRPETGRALKSKAVLVVIRER